MRDNEVSLRGAGERARRGQWGMGVRHSLDGLAPLDGEVASLVSPQRRFLHLWKKKKKKKKKRVWLFINSSCAARVVARS